MINKIFISGGAGFIGSNLCSHFLNKNYEITVFDNLSNGKYKNIEEFVAHKNFNFIECSIHNEKILNQSIVGHDLVIHLASNADIAATVNNPLIDFDEGVALTFKILESMRKNNLNKIIFTSGSGVYGEVPDRPISEDFAPLIPVSLYGAQKLSSESYISSYVHMFDFSAVVFRFANVVGPKQTHGVTHDFILKLKKNPNYLEILGNGLQKKPYIHVDDVTQAIEKVFFKLIDPTKSFDVYNVGSTDHLTVNDIADLVCKNLDLTNTKYKYTGGDKGWKGDVAKYSLDSTKLIQLGWSKKNSSFEAVDRAIKSMLIELNSGFYDF